MAVGELAVNVTARTTKARKNLNGFRKDAKRLGPVVNVLSGQMTRLGAGLAGFVAFRKLKQGITSSLESIDKLAKTAKKLNIATDELAGLRLAAEETGLGADGLDKSLERMVVNVSDAANGFGESRRELQALGVDLQSLNAMTPDRQFRAIADAITQIRNPADQARIAYKIFGKQGVSLLNTLRLGTAGMDEATAAARKLGIAVSGVDAAKVESANDAYGRLKKSIEGLFNRVAVGLAPAIEGVSKSLTEWITSGDQATSTLSSGSRIIAKGIGIVADVVHLVKMGFKGLQVVVTKVIAHNVRQFDTLQQAIVEVVNKIPGVDVKASTFVTALADGLEKTAADGAEELRKMFLAEPPSTGINKFFGNISTKASEAGKEVAKAVDPKQLAAARSGAKGLGAFIGKGLAFANAAASTSAKKAIAIVASQQGASVSGAIGINRAIDARSSEGMAALRANLRGSGAGKTVEKATQATEKHTNQTNKLLTKILNAFNNQALRTIPVG